MAMAPNLASKQEICLRMDVYDNLQTACVYVESSQLCEVPQFFSLNIQFGSLYMEYGASPSAYLKRIHVTERSRVSFIHDFRGCRVCVVVFDRRSPVSEGGSICDQLDEVYLPLVVEVLQSLMAIPWSLPRCANIKWLQRDIRSAMDQNCAGKMREENLVTSLERVEGSGLASQGLSVGARESIINPMTNSDGALKSAAMDKNRAGKGKEELFGPKDNLAVGLSDITFTGHGGGLLGLALQGGAGMHQSTSPLTNPELYHSPEAIQRRDGGSGLANSQDGTPLQGQVLQGAVVHKTHPMKWFASLATAGKDIYSSLASLGVSVSPDDLESQRADIPVLERIYYLLSEHDQTFQNWLRDAGIVGASFLAVYASPSLTTQLPSAVAFITTLTAMWLPRKCARTKRVLTKFGAIGCIASVMSAMVKYLSPVGTAIAGPLFLIPAGVVVLA